MVLDKMLFSGTEEKGAACPSSTRKRKKQAVQETDPLTPEFKAPESLFLNSSSDGQNSSAERAQQMAEIGQSTPQLPAELVVATSHQAVIDSTDEAGTMLDPHTSDRQYYRDRFTGIQREIWRPGDGDGKRFADAFGRAGPTPALEDRWRFYQSPTGVVPIRRDKNEPPKYVILDDLAAYELLKSNVPRKRLVDNWPHDFSGTGSVRHRRVHRGRAAVGDSDAQGDDKYHYTTIGLKSEKYYFTGEPNYKPVAYRSAQAELSKAVAAESSRTEVPPEPMSTESESPTLDTLGRLNSGRSQFTSDTYLVKQGAQSHAADSIYARPRLKRYLTQDPKLEPNFPKAKLYGQAPKHGLVSDASTMAELIFDGPGMFESNASLIRQDSLEIEDGREDFPGRKRMRMTEPEPPTPNVPTEIYPPHSSSSMDEFPFLRPAANKEVRSADHPRSGTPSPPEYARDLIAERNATYIHTAEDDSATIGGHDSFSYTSQLEGQLEMSQGIIAQQKAEIEDLRSANELAQERINSL